MPVDEIAEGLFRIFGRFILHFLIDIVFEVCCYFIGKVFLRIFTLGKYPPKFEARHSDSFVSLFGLLIIIGIATLIIYWF